MAALAKNNRTQSLPLPFVFQRSCFSFFHTRTLQRRCSSGFCPTLPSQFKNPRLNLQFRKMRKRFWWTFFDILRFLIWFFSGSCEVPQLFFSLAPPAAAPLDDRTRCCTIKNVAFHLHLHLCPPLLHFPAFHSADRLISLCAAVTVDLYFDCTHLRILLMWVIFQSCVCILLL